MPIEVLRIPALTDNYIWLLHDTESDACVVVDPAEADAVLTAANARGWRIGEIWNTHWHPDHTGGNAAIKAATGAIVRAPAAEAARIPTIDVALNDGDEVAFGAHRVAVRAVPGHTLGHIAFHFAASGQLFIGDTLFVMGCGRLFEGTPDQMFAAMRWIDTLDDATTIYCAHEYSLANARFAVSVEPGNAAVVARLAEIEGIRARGEPTVPTTLAQERATNPFLRAATVAEFAARRAAKDAA